jgi:mono/diheme cytochrome c family protein
MYCPHALIVALAVIGLGIVPATPGVADELLERGRYLTIAADCEGCHTDPAHPDRPFAGGRVIETPFGNIAAPNITPDADTGIGNWSDQQFDDALRRGIRADGSRLYPAMPYPYYTRMSAEEVRAIRTYLKTLPVVHNAIEADRLPFPLSIRAFMRVWDGMFFTPGDFRNDSTQSAQWNRGAYLVQGPGHCEACHTPKNLLGADEHGKAFEGENTQGWFSPNLTQNEATGLGSWSADDIALYLKSGHNRIAAAAGPMAEEVQFSSSHLSDIDLQAMAQYLKTLPARDGVGGRPLAADEPAMVAGAAIYQDLCTACHAAKGTGVEGLIPDIASAGSVASTDPATVLRVLLQGTQTVATDTAPTGPAMPGFDRRLTDEQVAAVATFIRNSWGHATSAVTESDVRKVKSRLKTPSL